MTGDIRGLGTIKYVLDDIAQKLPKEIAEGANYIEIEADSRGMLHVFWKTKGHRFLARRNPRNITIKLKNVNINYL